MKETIKVLLVKPGRYPEVTEIGTKLEDMQRTVGGLIEVCYAFDDEEVVIILDEEGKYDGSLPNRALYDEEGNIIDILFGSFFICDGSGEDFESLTEDKIEQYRVKFYRPEYFSWSNGKIIVTQYDPEEEVHEYFI